MEVMKMLDMASIILSVAGLLVSLITFFLNILDNRKIRRNYKIDNKTITLKYLESLRVLNNKVEANQLVLSDLLIHLKDIHEILISIYPSNHFRISIKVIQVDSDPSKALVKDFINFDNGAYSEIKTSPILIKDNTDFSAILYDDRDFFFVSDIEEYDRLRDYKNSDSTFRKSWVASLVFPIKKNLYPSSRHIIGFLCISSKNSLSNPKKNEIIMKLFPRIAENLYEILEKMDKKYIEEYKW